MFYKISIVCLLSSSLLFSAPSKPKKDKTDQADQKAFNEGYSLQKKNNYQEAVEKYSLAISLNPNYAEAFNNRAYCYKMIAKDYLKLSGQSYVRALEIKPNFPEALEYQGTYFIMNGEIENAYKNYKTLLSLDEKEAKELKSDLDPVLIQAEAVLKQINQEL
jgi:tetratricopeptide (TPR) repeat protein